ncbi:MAG: TetR/AcrR family transcriptional regulator [Hyphomicrobiaceae bacterium]|nr:MAG: TetR/AcrR family transcriptional regulator [Hyphomicrobiaceae bacterium]
MPIAKPVRRKRPGHYHHGDLRRALIDTALRVIEEDGLAAVTTRALARRLGVSHAAPAHHFRDREALFVEVATEGFQAFVNALESAAATAASDPNARLCAIGLAYVRFAIEHPAHVRVMFGGGLREGVRWPPALKRESERAYRVLVDTATAARASTGAPSGSVQDLAFGGWSLVHGMAMLWIDGPARQTYATPAQFEAAAARLIASMFCCSERPAAKD